MSGTPPVRRIWAMAEVMYVDQPRSPEESRAVALARLREIIRGEGYVIDANTLVSDEPQPIVVNADQTDYRPAEPGETPNAFLTRWSAGATERHQDTEEAILEPSAMWEAEGVVTQVFDVPDVVGAVGGGVRLRHGCGGPVTVKAQGTGSRAIGYLMAVALDEDQEQVEIVPGTVRLLVTKDPDPDEPGQTGETGEAEE